MKVERNECSEVSIEVLMAYRGMIYSTAKKYLGKRYLDWAPDITQDVLLKAWKNGAIFQTSRGTLNNWLYTMTKNACFDLMDKKVNNTEMLANDVFMISSNESDADVRYTSMKASVKLALNELSQRDRTLLIMRFYFKCSGKEIAEFLEIPEKNMASYMKRAKERLRILLDYAQAA